MTFKPKDTKDRILHRLKITKGHLEKVISMVEDHEYCIDVLHQLQAIEENLKSTGHVIMENHLETCVADAIKQGKSEEAISEIMSVLKKNQ